MDAFVKVRKGDDPCTLAEEILVDVVNEDLKGKSVLLKPNVGFVGREKSGLCTHPEIIRGLIRFLKTREVSKIFVGDSSVIGVDTIEALRSAGILQVCEEEGAICMDLNSSNPVDMKIKNGHVVDSILLSSIVFEVDTVISVGVMKNHMHTGASLSIKNMKGAMYKREKNKLHRLTKKPPEGAKERSLDFGILDLTSVLYPNYSVIDGTVGMEGFGPSGGTPKEVGLILASSNPVACDPVETVIQILLRCKGAVATVYFSMDMEDVYEIMKSMDISIGSDGLDFDYDINYNPHPRNFGTFPRFLRILREEKLLSLQDGIYKMTALPAKILGLEDRGILKVGNIADITIFDFNVVRDEATFVKSTIKPTGIVHVFVAGNPAIQDGALTEFREGRVLLS